MESNYPIGIPEAEVSQEDLQRQSETQGVPQQPEKWYKTIGRIVKAFSYDPLAGDAIVYNRSDGTTILKSVNGTTIIYPERSKE